MKNSILGKARWLREVALATSKNNGARVAREWLKYAAMFVMLFTIGSGNVWGALTEEYSYTFSAKQFSDNSTEKTLGTITWTPSTSWSSGSGYWGYDATKGQQWGSKSNGLNTLTLTAGSSISNIKKITINASIASSGSCTLSVKVGNTTIGEEKPLTSTATSYDFESPIGLTGAVQIKLYNNSVKKAQYIKSITIYTEAAASKTLSSIDITTQPTTTKYIVGETFSKTGAVVTASYSDATTADVSSSATWTPTTGLTSGSNTITASYTEGGVTKTATTTVTAYTIFYVIYLI